MILTKKGPRNRGFLFWFGFFLIGIPWQAQAQIEVPRTISFVGIELRLTPGSQKIIQEYVSRIYESPRYFNEMVIRAHLYFPHIEQALTAAGVPDDLKYLTIMESSLRPDVISSSLAVGFWQFKETPGREYGLQIDKQVDERSHIFYSSQAAARYLLAANRDFDNWLYAVIAYYEGFSGAVQHTDPQYYTAKQMVIDENCHWYALKFLANKLAYGAILNELETKQISFLAPFSNQGITSLEELADNHDITLEELLVHNKWIRSKRNLPDKEDFIYFVYVPSMDINAIYRSISNFYQTDIQVENTNFHLPSSAQEADPQSLGLYQIKDVSFRQDGPGDVLVFFDLEGPQTNECTISIFWSQDRGKTFTKIQRRLRGDYGLVEPGPNKQIRWMAWQEIGPVKSEAFMIRVVAEIE